MVHNPDGLGAAIYIRMELLESLTQVLRDKTMTAREAVQLGIDLCGALRGCESRRIIHRDIKPDNIFRSAFGTYKLGDFGIARQMEQTRASYSQKGTPNYIAPEIFLGKKYDRTVDVYSLGIVLYRLLNRNRLPFLPPAPQILTPKDNDTAFVRRMHGEPLPPPAQADAELAAIILRACDYDPAKRYQHAAELENDLRAWVDGTLRAGERKREKVTPSVRTEPKAASRAQKAETTDPSPSTQEQGRKPTEPVKPSHNAGTAAGKKKERGCLPALLTLVLLFLAVNYGFLFLQNGIGPGMELLSTGIRTNREQPDNRYDTPLHLDKTTVISPTQIEQAEELCGLDLNLLENVPLTAGSTSEARKQVKKWLHEGDYSYELSDDGV